MIGLHAQPTPTWDDFETVTITFHALEPGGHGHITLVKDVSIEDARAFAGSIEVACQIVEADGA